jgi:hypothetical protein
MKLISIDVLKEYGFSEKKGKSENGIVIMSRDNFDVIVKADGYCYYMNMGFEYPLKDIAALRKLFKEVRQKDL